MDYEVSFHFGAKRRRKLPFLPRAGDNITLYDAHGVEPDENNPKELRLKIDSFHAYEDEDGKWRYWANCSVLS
jgi:hypothetical protein